MPEANHYTSCAFIEGGLTFTPASLYHCCISLHSSSGWAKICDYEGGSLPIETILQSRENHRKQLADNACKSCDGCSAFLFNKAWPTENKYLFNSLVLNHYTVCNMQCNYCCWLTTHPISFGQKPYSIFPVLKEIVTNGWMDPDGLIAWGGGEPALCEEFSACLDFMMSRNYAHEVYSNAACFSQSICDYLDSGKLKLMVSVDAGCRETYHKMKRANVWENVWENLEKYARRGGESITIKYIVTSDNYTEFEWMPFIKKVSRLCPDCSVGIDVSHSEPRVQPFIIDAMVKMEDACLQQGINVLTGIHGAHSLPKENVIERLETRREELVNKV